MDWKQQFREKFTDEKGEEWVAGRDYSPSPKAIESFIQELVEKEKEVSFLKGYETCRMDQRAAQELMRDKLYLLRPPAQTGEEEKHGK